MKSPIWVVAGLVEPVLTMTTPASWSTPAAGMLWLDAYVPSTATAPSSMNRLAQATEPSGVLALSQIDNWMGLSRAESCSMCAT